MESNLLGCGLYAYGYYQYNERNTLHLIFRNPYVMGSRWGYELQYKRQPVYETYRITSYNVCYTKLLRFFVNEMPQQFAVHFFNHIGFEALLSSPFPTRCNNRIETLLRNNTFPGWFLKPHHFFHIAQTFRITSYNVCYTKLLRLPMAECAPYEQPPVSKGKHPFRQAAESESNVLYTIPFASIRYQFSWKLCPFFV